jgi:hypothetical protein
VRVSATAFLFSVFVLWVVIGVVSAFVMGRRGHAPYPWLVLGALLGPFVIPVALAQTREQQRVSVSHVEPSAYRGPVDVLVGIDGSVESLAAADVVTRLLNERIGRLTLATVVNYEAGDVSSSDARRSAEDELAGDVQPCLHGRGPRDEFPSRNTEVTELALERTHVVNLEDDDAVLPPTGIHAQTLKRCQPERRQGILETTRRHPRRYEPPQRVTRTQPSGQSEWDA